ncbi:MAG TPA: 50S ribosomal protein L3 [Patescibacteria group bacterium]|nr:50S ribosomal protein L3 [Patescibacteria group bacterium]
MNFILARKIGMTQVYDDKNHPQPVTVVEAGPCYISQLRTPEKDGYTAVQLAFREKKHLLKTQKGHLAKAKISKNLSFVREIPAKKIDNLELGQEIKADIFQTGDKVNVQGVSKGKGFAGVIKRHGFSRGPETHGSHHHRRPGSIGSMFPQHVVKGKKMPGHMGSDNITIKKAVIIDVQADKNIILIKGAVPGAAKSNLVLVKAE